MLEEKFDFFPLLGDYIDKEINIVRYYKEEQAWEAETTDGEESEEGEYCEDCGVYHEKPHKLSKEELDEMWAPLKKFSEKQQQFADELMAAMSEKVRKRYPEFAEADTERLMELTGILSTGADDIARKVAFLSGPPADTSAYMSIDE
jgi:DNA repair exonuclease SbcCD ATPase subunit